MINAEYPLIDISDFGVVSCGDDCGPLAKFIEGNHLEIVEVKDGFADFLGKYKIPLHKMIGVIGVAPENESVPCGTPGRHGGNMDNTKIAKGATLYLPVFHDGAYFGCGDVHACMGDGEIMVSGIEIGAVVSVRLTVLKGVSIDNPRLEDAENIYTIASSEDIEKAMQAGFSTASSNVRSLGFGAGMGLPNMKKNSDTMDIETTLGVGTTVTMTVNI